MYIELASFMYKHMYLYTCMYIVYLLLSLGGVMADAVAEGLSPNILLVKTSQLYTVLGNKLVNAALKEVFILVVSRTSEMLFCG